MSLVSSRASYGQGVGEFQAGGIITASAVNYVRKGSGVLLPDLEHHKQCDARRHCITRFMSYARIYVGTLGHAYRVGS